MTEWNPAGHLAADVHDKSNPVQDKTCTFLQKQPIRIDRLNRPSPPGITRVTHQIRSETLHLWYQLNIFECWRPLLWQLHSSDNSTFFDWLRSLGRRRAWLRNVVLLYKTDAELQIDLDAVLAALDLELTPGIVRPQLELSAYEMCYEQMGLPRQFGRKRATQRWVMSAP